MLGAQKTAAYCGGWLPFIEKKQLQAELLKQDSLFYHVFILPG